jgi:acetylornithine deacetylase/succinyl-diaminopimelate desuccinylase-like protein
MQEIWSKVRSLINPQELTELALTLGNIASPAGDEAPVGNYLIDWLRRNGFTPKKIGIVPERFCVAAAIRGSGDGLSLLFNSHMDTSILDKPNDGLNPSDPKSQEAWIAGEHIVGQGVVNDKGPMAAFLIAAKAIKQAGVPLKGDLVVTMVPGEIDQEPVDEFDSPRYLSKEVGSRYLISRGIIADFALVAEGTDFKLNWAGAGKACFKITVYGKTIYVPFLPTWSGLAESPNAIMKMAAVLAALGKWSEKYERENTVDTPGGRVVPKANVGALRGGLPFHISTSAKACVTYMDIRLAPEADPLAIRAELYNLLAECGVEGTVELYIYRKAQVAQGIEPLVEAVERAHAAMGVDKPGMAAPVYSSMWRDHIAFIEAGIPALTYGPSGSVGSLHYAMRLDDLLKACHSYALIALDICGRSKRPRGSYSKL